MLSHGIKSGKPSLNNQLSKKVSIASVRLDEIYKRRIQRRRDGRRIISRAIKQGKTLSSRDSAQHVTEYVILSSCHCPELVRARSITTILTRRHTFSLPCPFLSSSPFLSFNEGNRIRPTSSSSNATWGRERTAEARTSVRSCLT